MLEAILPAVACVAGIGLLCAVILVAAAKFMAVRENKLEKELRACLPGVNCGACGYAGCDSYARALADGTEKQTNLCIPGADAVSKQISKSLGVAFQNTVEQVAAIHCCGDCEHAVQKASYSGVQTCSGAKMLYGGQQACTYGCLGKGDCAAICPYDAIYMEKGIAHVHTPKCVGAEVCPVGCILSADRSGRHRFSEA